MSKHASTADTEARRDVEPRTVSEFRLPLTALFYEFGHDVSGYNISLSMMDQLVHGGDPTMETGETAAQESDSEFDMIGVGH